MRGVAVAVALLGCGRFDFATRNDGGGDAAGSGGPACNRIERIADDFADGVESHITWGASYTDPGTSLAETGGELVITPATNNPSQFAGYTTMRYYDLREGRMFAEVAQVTTNMATTGIAIDYDSMTFVHLGVKGGQIFVAQLIGGTYTLRAMMPYLPAAHRFWAIAERGGRTYFETSADGVAFTPMFDMVDPFDMSLVKVSLFAGSDTAIAAPGTAHFASFNGGVQPPPQACRASTLRDGFDAGVVGHTWANTFGDPCCTISEPAGTLQIATNGTNGFTGVRSSAGFDLTDDAISVAVPVFPIAASTFYGTFGVQIDDANKLELELTQSQFTAHTVIAGASTTMMSQRNAGENYIQLRETAGTFVFEVSADRQTWRAVETRPTPFAVRDVLVSFTGGIFGAASAATTIAFDNLNQ